MGIDEIIQEIRELTKRLALACSVEEYSQVLSLLDCKVNELEDMVMKWRLQS